MQCKTPVTITWVDPYHDWHWFWLRQKQGSKLLLTGANAPDGTPHDGGSFWCDDSEIMVIKKGHIKPLFLPDWSSWWGLTLSSPVERGNNRVQRDGYASSLPRRMK